MNTDQMRQVAAAIITLADADVAIYGADLHHQRVPSVQVYTHTVEDFADRVRKVTTLAGKVDKVPTDCGMDVVGFIDGVRVQITDVSGQVCERVLVGTDVVEEQVPDPQWEGEVPTVTITREVPRYEIRCPDSVLALTRDEVSA